MDFRILGPLEVLDDGRALELGGARQRALLAILLLRHGHVVKADRLIEDLYGGRPPATAAKSLQAHVSRLRRALGPEERLRTRAGGYVLEVHEGELDADRCRRLLADARRALAGGRPGEAAESLASALALWRGAPLVDVAYEAFAQEEIAWLEQLRLDLREERLEADLALGRHAEVTGELEQLVATHPLRERLRGQLMLALYRGGRQAEALGVYQAGRRALVEELGIDPGRALQQRERAILNQDPELELVAAPAGAAPVASGRPGRLAAGAFVGREQELSLLERSLADVQAGRGRLAVITGERGSGKSRLADELASRAKSVGARVLWGGCWEAGGAPAYWPWLQALRAYVREGEPAAGELPALLADSGEPPAGDTEEARFHLFDATTAFIRRAAAVQPLLLVLDDVHAADPASLLLLEFAVVELADAPVLLVAAYRDQELAAGPQADAVAAATRRASLRLALHGLSQEAVATYLALTAPFDAPAELVAAITAETGGNPLRLGEAVRSRAAASRLPCGREESNLQGPEPTGT